MNLVPVGKMGQKKGFKHTPEFAARLLVFAKRRKSKKWHASIKASWTPEKRAAARAKAVKQWLESPPGRRYSGTVPELLVQGALASVGIAFEAQFKLGGALYDFAVESKRILIEVDGCYWHNCDLCGYANARPEAYKTDKRKNTLALRAGWRLIRIPEHAVKDGSFRELLVKL